MDYHVRQRSKEGIWKENRHHFRLEGEHSWYLAYLIKFSVSGNKLESIYLIKEPQKMEKERDCKQRKTQWLGDGNSGNWAFQCKTWQRRLEPNFTLSRQKVGRAIWRRLDFSHFLQNLFWHFCANMVLLTYSPFYAFSHSFYKMELVRKRRVSALFTLSAGTTTHAIPHIQI